MLAGLSAPDSDSRLPITWNRLISILKEEQQLKSVEHRRDKCRAMARVIRWASSRALVDRGRIRKIVQ